MKIGTDVSLKECWESGYLVMDFKVRDLFPNGRKNGIDKDAYVNFYRSDGGAMGLGISGITKIVDTCACWNDLMEMYQRHQESIDSMCGYNEDNPRPGLDTPDEYVMLHLASDIDMYCGLE